MPVVADIVRNQPISTIEPTTMQATAPWKVKLRQKRLSMMAGPKAAPNTPQALETSSIMLPARGESAIRRAMKEITSTTMRPAHSISLSADLFLRITGLYTSLAKAEAEDSSWLEAVLMEAASTPESKMPLMIAGKMLRTIAMKTREFLLIFSSMPKYMRPTTPTIVAKKQMSAVQLMAMMADFFISFCEPRDMKRMMI